LYDYSDLSSTFFSDPPWKENTGVFSILLTVLLLGFILLAKMANRSDMDADKRHHLRTYAKGVFPTPNYIWEPLPFSENSTTA
jgi:hypothetical protein